MEIAALPIPYYSDSAASGNGRRTSAGKTGRILTTAIRGGSPEEQILQGELLKKNRSTTGFHNADENSTGNSEQEKRQPLPRPRAALTGSLQQQTAINSYLDHSEPINTVLADRDHLVNIFV